MAVPPKPDPIKHCQTCGTMLTRKRFGKRLDEYSMFLSRVTCWPACAATKVDVTLAAHRWRAAQHRGSECQECGTTERLHVHHIDRTPSNNDPTNLMTLCASCHIRLHWREDRPQRMEAARKAQLTLARTRQRSAAGKAS